MSSSFFPFSSSPRTPSAYITHLRSTQDSVWAVGSPRSLCCIDARSLSTRHSMELPSFPSTSTIQDMYASHSSSVAVVLSEGRWVQWDLRLAGGKAERAQLEWKVPGDRSALSLSSSAHQWAVGTDYKDEAAFIYLMLVLLSFDQLISSFFLLLFILLVTTDSYSPRKASSSQNHWAMM